MSYKINNPYKESQIMDLNLMGIREHRKFSISTVEIAITAAPLLLAAVFILATVLPELSFFAECQNIGSGDLCYITMQ